MSGRKHVEYYTTGYAEIAVHFPENKIVCQWCPYCRNEDSLRRWKCLLTGEYLVYPFHSLGNECPITFEEDQDGEYENL